MTVKTIEDEIAERVKRLSLDQKKQVLDFVHQIEHPRGITGAEAIKLAREINFDPEDLAEIKRAIEEMHEEARNQIPWLRSKE